MLFQGSALFDDLDRAVFLRNDRGARTTLLIRAQGPGSPEANAYAFMGGNGSNTPTRPSTIDGRLVPLDIDHMAIEIDSEL